MSRPTLVLKASHYEGRVLRGISARRNSPRTSHARWAPTGERPDPVDILAAQSDARVEELVPVRYGRMLQSPFAFYRGAAAVMASDLAQDGNSTGLIVQLCGDAHLSNFGMWATPERTMIFGINDFDETLPGPFEWDLKRLAASFALYGREMRFTGAGRRAALMALGRGYRDWMYRFARMRELDLWYYKIETERAVAAVRRQRIAMKTVTRAIHQAHAKDHLRAFNKLTILDQGRRSIVKAPPLIVPASVEEAQDVEAKYEDYLRSIPTYRRKLLSRYRLVDVARKVVGVGSVGTRCWIALFEGRDSRDPLFLQMKEASASVLEPYIGASEFENHGERVVVGQRLTQAASDIFLGWSPGRTEGRDYYWRQLWDMKGSVEPVTERGLAAYAGVCGWALARAHAKTGDAAAIAAYIGANDRFISAIADFGRAYANQAEADYEKLAEAETKGRIEVIRGL